MHSASVMTFSVMKDFGYNEYFFYSLIVNAPVIPIFFILNLRLGFLRHSLIGNFLLL
jgi:hypothetical protein